MLGFQVDVTGFYALAEHDPFLSPLAHRFLGLKPPRFPSLFEALLNAFVCQHDVGAQKNLQRLLQLEEKPAYAKVRELTSPWQPYAGFVYFHLLLEKLEQQGILSQA